jgi:hypothetical protein
MRSPPSGSAVEHDAAILREVCDGCVLPYRVARCQPERPRQYTHREYQSPVGATQGKLRPDLITLDHLTENALILLRARPKRP